jgi:hypothetical protein
MTAATLVEGVDAYPLFECVQLTVTDGYTYTSKKLGHIVGGCVGSRSRAGAYISSISGTVVTIACSSASGDTMDLILWGFP